MSELKPDRIWVYEEEDGHRVTPTKPRYEGAYTEYVRAALTSEAEPVGWVMEYWDSMTEQWVHSCSGYTEDKEEMEDLLKSEAVKYRALPRFAKPPPAEGHEPDYCPNCGSKQIQAERCLVCIDALRKVGHWPLTEEGQAIRAAERDHRETVHGFITAEWQDAELGLKRTITVAEKSHWEGDVPVILTILSGEVSEQKGDE